MTQTIIDKKDYLTINKEELDFVNIAITTTNVDAKNLDDINNVFKDVFTLKNLSKNKQIHSNIVNKVDKDNIGQIIDGDAIITNEKNVPLLILTADCVPVVLVDTINKAVGLAHAGWRGTYGKICAETLQSMKENYNTKPEDVVAIIGPSIGKCCYEVSYDLVEKFSALLSNADEKIYEIRDDKYYLDLWEINTQILKEFGVLKSNIINMNICTSCNCDRFFSYRKHDKTPKRIGTFIEIK
ncbi:peptidoglycan editing factor PgeF [Intestinibacter sp.]|uniref:peptidoglycan editing factor PgeF n=1 Tax=Intestinibacter sp. TaxID=1965304 RepID=UPI002A91EE79|nr:peptidoglycan editing factor PgeF [Intestinibacter sp.]MDY5213109.1 peptidoglycan editing factor PgeF [Intestinibacter sp.]